MATMSFLCVARRGVACRRTPEKLARLAIYSRRPACPPSFYRFASSRAGGAVDFEDFLKEQLAELQRRVLSEHQARGASGTSAEDKLSVSELIGEVDRSLSSGANLRRGGAVYADLGTKLRQLRDDNDWIMAKVNELKGVRSAYVAEEKKIIERIRHEVGGDPYEPAIIETIRKIQEVDNQLTGLRCQHLQNSVDVGALKREKIRIEQREDVAKLVDQVENALAEKEPLSMDGPLCESIRELVKQFREEFDAAAHAVMTTRKELQGLQGNLTSMELSFRARRGPISQEVYEYRALLVERLIEARRKNAKLTRLRDIMILRSYEIQILEGALMKVKRNADVRELVRSDNQERRTLETTSMWRNIDHLQKTIQDLETKQAACADEAAKNQIQLRSLKDVSTPETAELRERLVGNLRDEETCLQRLAALRSVQAQNLMFVLQLKAST